MYIYKGKTLSPENDKLKGQEQTQYHSKHIQLPNYNITINHSQP